jgi:hypothetical protein
MNKVRALSASLFVALAIFGITLALPAPVAAQFQDNVNAACEGLSAAGDTGGCTGGGAAITKVIRTAISILSIVVGIAAVIVIIISGMKYVTSGGDASSVSSAKKGIIYALIGIAIAASAQMIIHFVLDRV